MILLTLAAAMLIMPLYLTAQDALAARAGLIYSFQGEVAIDGQALETTPGRYAILPLHAELALGTGAATLVLADGIFLDVGPHSSVRLRDDSLMQPSIEITGGTVRLLITRRLRGRQVSVIIGSAALHPRMRGDYTLNASRLDVAGGRMTVNLGARRLEISAGDHLLLPAPVPLVARDTPEAPAQP